MSEVEVDYWENQRYKPLQGWSLPYQGGIAPFSDISGKTPFQIELVTNNSVFVPVGWEWSPDSSWSIDLSGKFGQSDSDGWSYGLTFEGIVENSKLKKLKSERSTSNVVRRRRWTRARICVSTELNAIVSLKSIWGNIVREKISEVIEKNEVNYMRLTEYNSKQKKVIESILLAADLNLNEVNSTLDLLNEKLQSMKSFLVERGLIEAQYGKKLESLASKWMTAGMPKKAPTSRMSFSGDSAPPDKGSAAASNSGFFYVVSAANQSIAERLNEYSNLLCDALPKDVSRIIEEVADALLECKRDGQDLRNQISAKSRVAAQSYEVYSKCQENSQAQMIVESDAVQSSLQQSSASGSEQSVLVVPSTAEEKESCFHHLQTVDVWLAMQLYNTDLIELDSTMLQYNAFCKQQQKKAAAIGAKVGELLQSTVKVFAYEQFRVWQDSASMLDAVASGGSRSSSSNPMRGDDSPSVNSVVTNTVSVNANPLRRKSVNTTLSSVSEESPLESSTVVANNVNPLRKTPSKSSSADNLSLSSSNLGSGSGDGAVFVNPMKRTKSAVITPVKQPQQQYPSSNFEETDLEDVVTSGFEQEFELAEAEGVDLNDNDDDGNRDATLKLPSHSHLRLSNSKAQLVKVGVMKVLILRSGMGSGRSSSGDLSALVAGTGISGLSTANNKTSAIGAIDYDQFQSAVVLLTFNRVLHVMLYSEEVASAVETEVSGASAGDFVSSGGLEGVTNSGTAVATSLSSAIDATTERLLANDNICFDKHKLLLSINLAAGCHVGPVFIPKDGFRDSFEVRVPPQPRSITTSLSTMMGGASATVHKTDTRGISSVLFTTDDSIKVRNWMRCMSNPFVDPNIDSPQDFDCEDNEYIVMGTNLDKGGRADTTEV